AAARVELQLRLPAPVPWNADDSIAAVVINHTAQPTPEAALELFVQAPVAVPVDTAAPGHPAVQGDTAGATLAFALAPVAAGQRAEVRQAVRTPPAPTPPEAPGAAPQPAPAAAKSRRLPAPARPDTL